MSVAQLRSINEARLRRRATAYGKRVTSKKAPAVAIAFVGDGWLDGYKAALDDVRKMSQAKDGADHTAAGAGSAIMNWLEEMPQ